MIIVFCNSHLPLKSLELIKFKKCRFDILKKQKFINSDEATLCNMGLTNTIYNDQVNILRQNT